MATMEDVKKRNQEKGYYFFEPETIRFWNCTIETNLLRGKYFITSEDNYDRSRKLFTIRKFDWATGVVNTVGEFQAFKTLKEAMEYLMEEV